MVLLILQILAILHRFVLQGEVLYIIEVPIEVFQCYTLGGSAGLSCSSLGLFTRVRERVVRCSILRVL